MTFRAGYVIERTLAADLVPAIRRVLDGQLAYPVAASRLRGSTTEP